MRLHPTSCPFPRQAFDELLNSVSEYGKNDRPTVQTALGLSGSQTDRPSSHHKFQDLRKVLNGTNDYPQPERNCGELRSQRSLKVAKVIYTKGHRSFMGTDDALQQTKHPWDGTVYNEVSTRGTTAGTNRSKVSFAMDGCEQSIARLQRDLEESGKKGKPFLKSFVQESSNDGEFFKERILQPIQTLRPSSFSVLQETTDSKGQKPNLTSHPSYGLKTNELEDAGNITAIVMKLSITKTFLDFLKVIRNELMSVCECERVQLHFVNPILNLSKLDGDDFQRPFDLWSANFPETIIPTGHSQQAARQCITIRINEEAGKGSVLYVPIPIPASETASWKIFGVAELYRSTQNFWTQADEGKVKFMVDIISSMCIQRYKACRKEFERRQAVLMKDATKSLHSQEHLDMLCSKAANFACLLTNAKAARVLLASDDGKSAAVYTLHPAQKRGFRPPANAEEQSSMIEGELSAVYTTVIRTGKSLAVADTRRDPRFSSTLRPVLDSSGPPRLTLARPVSGTAADVAGSSAAMSADPMPPRPNTAPFVGNESLKPPRNSRSSRSVTEAAAPESKSVLQPQPPPTVKDADSTARPPRYRGGGSQAGGGSGKLPRHAGLVYCGEDQSGASTADADDLEELDVEGVDGGSCRDPAAVREVAENAILMAIVDDDAEIDLELDRGGGDEASQQPVRGVLEVVNKRSGPFDEADRKALVALCGILYRCLVRVGRAQVLQEILDCDCRLLAGSSVQQVVAAALDKAKVSTRSELAAFYTPVEGRRVLASDGVAPRHEVPLYDDTGYPIATAYRRKQTIQIDNHVRDSKLQASGLAQAVPFFRAMKHSISKPVMHPFEPDSIMGVILLANKSDSLDRGYDEIDHAKLDNIALKMSHALVGILRQRHLQDRCAAEHALTRCCSEFLSAKSQEDIMRVVSRFAPPAFDADDVSVWLPYPNHNAALWTSLSARATAAAKDQIKGQLESAATDNSDVNMSRDKFLIPFPDWLSAESEVVMICNGSSSARLQWAAEACSVNGQQPASDAAVICVLPLTALSGGQGGVLLFRLTGRRAQKDANVDREMALQLRAAIVQTLRRVKEEEDLLKGASILEQRLKQHEILMRWVPQVVAQTSVGRLLNAAHCMTKEVIHAGRADLYLLDHSSVSTDGKPMLVWHDPDKALTANLSMAPDLQLPMGGLVGVAASSHDGGYPGIVVCNHVAEDPRYDKEIDNRSHLAQPTTMMCIPIVSASADQDTTESAASCFGVLQIVNKIDPGGFNDYDSQIAAQASVFIGTCLESSRRQDRQGELLLSTARFAGVLTTDAIIRAMVSASSEWLVERARVLRVWVSRNNSHNTLLLLSCTEMGENTQDHGILGSPPRATFLGPHQDQASKLVMNCFSKREKIHIRGDQTLLSGVQSNDTCPACERLCLPICFPAKDASISSSADGQDRVWGVFEIETLPGECFTALDISLMATVANHAGVCIAHAEAKTEVELASAATGRLFQKTASLFSSKSTVSLFQVTCSAAHQVVDAQHISLFALDSEGRQVREEYTENGGILQADSPCYKLKRRIAMMVGHSMSEVGSFVAEDIEARSGGLGSVHEGEQDLTENSSNLDDNGDRDSDGTGAANKSHKKLYHCVGFPLWRARATEELSKGGPGGTSRPLYGVLVCLRPITSHEFRPAECMPLQYLCLMAAEHVIQIRKKAEKLGASFVRRTSVQAQKELDEKHGGDVGRSILTELAARRFRGAVQRSPSPGSSALLAVAAAAQTLARSPSARRLSASPGSRPGSGIL